MLRKEIRPFVIRPAKIFSRAEFVCIIQKLYFSFNDTLSEYAYLFPSANNRDTPVRIDYSTLYNPQ